MINGHLLLSNIYVANVWIYVGFYEIAANITSNLHMEAKFGIPTLIQTY
jgi:hypothetical protein